MGSKGSQSWFAGAVIERKPDKNPNGFKQKLSEAGIEEKGWKLFDPDDSIDITFERHLVAMKSKNLAEFKDYAEVVEYITRIIDEVGTAPHVESGRNIVYN